MRLPLFLGKIAYIAGYLGIRLIVYGSTRAYVVLLYNDSIVLTKNWLGLHNIWRLPGGGVKHSETPSQAAVREVLEETGVHIDEHALQPLGGPIIAKKLHFTYYIYVLKLPKNVPIYAQGPEITDAAYISKQELSGLELGGEVREALNRLSWKA